MRARKIISALCYISFAVGSVSSSAHADCNPIDFLVDDFQNLILTDSIRTAFLLSATRDQYNRLSQANLISLSYAPVSKPLTYDQARQSAERETQFAPFAYSRQDYADFLSQQMSVGAVEKYSSCLETGKSLPGLRVWYSQRKGEYIYLKAFWTGADSNQHVGKLEESQHVDELKIVQMPVEWPRGETQQIVVKRTSSADGLLNFRVGGLEQTFIVLKDPPQIQVGTSVVGGPVVRITSGGTSDGHSPFCQRRTVSSCVAPQKGGYLLAGTGDGSDINASTPGRVGKTVTRDTPEQVCVEFWAATAACETEVSIQGRATAIERFPIK
jgi:hypothetical protein